MYRLIVTRHAAKDLEKLPPKDQLRVLGAFDALRENPHAGKPMHGEMKGQWSLRLWPYRIIYVCDHKTVTVAVIKIGHRQGIYKK